MCSIPHGWSYSSLGALILPSWLLLHCGSPGEPNHWWDSSCTTSCFMKSRNFLHVSEPLRLLVSFSQSSFPCDKACKRIFYKSAILHPSFSRIGPIAFKGNSFFLFCCEHISNLLNTSKFHILIISIHQSSERGLILRKLSPLQVKELQLRLLHSIRHDFKSASPSASYPMEKFQLKPDPM